MTGPHDDGAGLAPVPGPGTAGPGAGTGAGSIATVAGAIGYLILTSTRNRLRRQLVRLRSPRVLAAVALASLWIYAIVWSSGEQPGNAAPMMSGELARHVIVLATFLGAAYYWLIGNRRVLAFTPAEVDLLFQAPLTRRQLVLYKLLRLQVATLASVLILSVLWRRGGGGVLEFVLHAAALWVLLSTLQLHRLAAALVRIGAVTHGRAGLARMALPLSLFGVAVGAVVAAFALAWPAGGISSASELGEWLRAAMGSTPARVALLPARIAVAPWYAATVAEWLRTIGPALLLLGVHVAWVVRTDTAFEEAAVDAAASRAREIRAIATGAPSPRSLGRKLTASIPLAPTGLPTVAILWKNTLAAFRGERVAPAVVIFPVMALGLVVFRSVIPDRVGNTVGVFLSIWVIATLALGPLWVRNDLRRDLRKLEIVHAWPLGGATVVGASALSSALIISLLTLLAAVTALAAAWPSVVQEVGVVTIVAGGLAFTAGVPAVSLIGTLVHNGAALLFPAWVQLGPDRPAGLEAIGQLYLTMFISLIAMAILVILPVLAAVLVLILLPEGVGEWAWPIAALAAAPVVLAEAWLLTQWLGEVLERTEPHAVPQS